ncbi:MAG: hypothetical protein HGA19_14210, partial [Oscillochloris sp.]|nr:hypothetical protein [Oscillochloris sp.]
PGTGLFIELTRGLGLHFAITWIGAIIVVSAPLLMGLLAGLMLLIMGMLLRIAQGFVALRSIKSYARLVRQRFALQMYHDEQQRLRMVARHLDSFAIALTDELTGYQQAAIEVTRELRRRADRLAELAKHDVTEYAPLALGGPVAFYDHYIAPIQPELIERDLLALRRFAQIRGPLADALASDKTALLNSPRQRIWDLVLGDPTVTELDERACLRFLAYRTMQQALDQFTTQSISQAVSARAIDLHRRTRLMLHSSHQPDTFEQSYVIVPLSGTAQTFELAETIEIRSLDHQLVIFCRIVSHVWPRLFEAANLKLIP